MKYVWIGLGWLFVILGVVGIVLPLLPTTPFLLAAAVCFSRGSQQMHHWLVNHPTLGPPIVNWQTNRTITRKVKVVALLSMSGLFGISVLMGINDAILLLQGVVLIIVGVFLWRQKEPQTQTESEELS
jgi:uncharacterized membrane protein YbaN (DUF454 family)